MDGSQLGKKLKEARLTKKMTQSDVVGTFITRNMLSQIESGAAFPSLRTLEYLANTLEIPIHYLISQEQDEYNQSLSETENDDEKLSPAVNSFLKNKTAYLRGDYEFIIRHANELDDKGSMYYDESVALLCRAYLKTAVLFLQENKHKSAIAYARLAARYGEIGIYASREIRTEALLLLDELSETNGAV